jgi:transposase-like protein
MHSRGDADTDTQARFADELSAYGYLEKIIWPNRPICPRCGVQGRIRKLNGATTRLGSYKCYACRKQFNLVHGTIFSGSHAPLNKWLQAVYLTDGGTKFMRPYQLHKILDVSIKTAAHMMERLHHAATSPPASE